MFRRKTETLRDVVLKLLRDQGLETPILQKRLVEAWPTVAGETVARYTTGAYVYNQTLFVRLSSPALRADLSMQRQQYVKQLNEAVGERVITDIRFC